MPRWHGFELEHLITPSMVAARARIAASYFLSPFNAEVVAFDRTISDGTIPPLTIAFPTDYCVGMAQVVVEP